MVREILRATGRGKKAPKSLNAAVDLPPLGAPDYEYLFLQLLEGVAHGWQQPRVMKFFAKLKHRVPKSTWLEWLESFGEQLTTAPNPNEDLARRMIQLSDLDCGEFTSLAGDYGHRVLSKIYGGYTEDFLPELEGAGVELGYLPEFGMGAMDLAAMDLDFQLETSEPDLPGPELLPEDNEDNLEEPIATADRPDNPATASSLPPALTNALNAPVPPVGLTGFHIPEPSLAPPHPLEQRFPSTPVWDEDNALPTFGEVPPELRLDSKRSFPPPAQPIWSRDLASDETIETIEPAGDTLIEERQISIEEFDTMLRSDPELLQQIAQQLGIETNDPQVVIDRVMAQMQEQIQDVSQP